MGIIQRLATRLTDRIYEMPALVLMPHSRCNCRCVMCDIWKANQDKSEISVEELKRHVNDFKRLGVCHVTLSGGEALMHSNLWAFCEVMKATGMKISLLSTGLTLEHHAGPVLKYFDDVIISLDGGMELHNRIRNIPQAFSKLRKGVLALKNENPRFRITGRCVLQRLNFRDFAEIIETAKELGLDQISFLAADVSTRAFNRDEPWQEEKKIEIALSREESLELEQILEKTFVSHERMFSSGFVAESQEKLKRLAKYYQAFHQHAEFESPACNAPWVSAVIETNGDILPCFFHRPYGNLKEGFVSAVNGPEAVQFRKSLDVKSNPICQKCVCSLYRPVW